MRKVILLFWLRTLTLAYVKLNILTAEIASSFLLAMTLGEKFLSKKSRRISCANRNGIFCHSQKLRHILTVLFCLLLVACGGPSEKVDEQLVFSGSTMGTIYNVKVIKKSVPPENTGKIEISIKQALDSINNKMSTYKKDSELSLFNKHEDKTPFPVSKDTLEVFQLAQQVSELSNGAFDITVGPLVNAWGFGPDKRSLVSPEEDELKGLRSRVGYEQIHLDEENSTISKDRPDMYCDLSAIAKGYGVDKVAEALDQLGCTDYMVEVGGETKAKGKNSRGVLWQIAIEKPTSDSRTIHKVISLNNQAMATSGDYRNYFEVDGVRLSHTIDPRTGRPIKHNLASVTVIHESCALADAYATMFMVLGPDEGYKLAAKHDLAAYFIIREAKDSFVQKVSPKLANVSELE